MGGFGLPYSGTLYPVYFLLAFLSLLLLFSFFSRKEREKKRGSP